MWYFIIIIIIIIGKEIYKKKMLLSGINQFRNIIIHDERRNRNVKIWILLGVNRLILFSSPGKKRKSFGIGV